MNKRKIIRIFLAVLIVLNMTAIFSLSAQKAVQSDETSAGFITALCKALVSRFNSLSPQEKESLVASLSFAVRKGAHMAEFAALSFLCSLFAASFGVKLKNFAAAFAFAVFYAATDELHQLFVEGRSCQFSDVCVDSVGALLGVGAAILLCLLFLRLFKRNKSRKCAEKIHDTAQ